MNFLSDIADGIIALCVIAFALGIVVAVVSWALWHFVLSHIHLVWR